MDPTAFKLFGIEIRYYGLLLAFAFLVAYFLIKHLAGEFGIKKKYAEEFMLISTLLGIIGARVFEIFFYDPAYYMNHPLQTFCIWKGGLASHGAIFSIVIFTYFYSKKRKIPFLKLADLAVIPGILFGIFIRIGNFINNELIGKPTNIWIGIKINNIKRHPVQLYQAFSNLIVFSSLYTIKKFVKEKPGFLFSSFLFLYSLLRLITEFYKELPPGYGFSLFHLNLAQWISLVLMIASVILFLKLRRCKLWNVKKKKT